jgi:hypothetical protein
VAKLKKAGVTFAITSGRPPGGMQTVAAGLLVSMEAAITDLVHLIEQGESEPHPVRPQEMLK